jgi:hypothetical protein
MTGVTNFGDIVASPMCECDLPDSRSKSKMRHSDWCGELIVVTNWIEEVLLRAPRASVR